MLPGAEKLHCPLALSLQVCLAIRKHRSLSELMGHPIVVGYAAMATFLTDLSACLHCVYCYSQPASVLCCALHGETKHDLETLSYLSTTFYRSLSIEEVGCWTVPI